MTGKKDLVRKVKEKTTIARPLVKDLVDAVLEGIEELTMEEGTLRLTGFGTFKATLAEAHTARNPRTGEIIDVPDRMRVGFKAGAAFKALVNGENPEDE